MPDNRLCHCVSVSNHRQTLWLTCVSPSVIITGSYYALFPFLQPRVIIISLYSQYISHHQRQFYSLFYIKYFDTKRWNIINYQLPYICYPLQGTETKFENKYYIISHVTRSRILVKILVVTGNRFFTSLNCRCFWLFSWSACYWTDSSLYSKALLSVVRLSLVKKSFNSRTSVHGCPLVWLSLVTNPSLLSKTIVLGYLLVW